MDSYQEAIKKLNKLQSNAKTIKNSIIKDAINTDIREKEIRRDNILRYLKYTGCDAEDLSRLSVIHIAGTKGKGSTSALCESILRHHGYKTGFYSSPHLLLVTERIRLNGLPIQFDYFAEVFHQIYDQLQRNQQYEGDMPHYFGFLTVMALNIFIKEKVDVAIVEVGIGGEYDQTNILKNVPVVGITSLGYDHTDLLGESLEEIAVQKAGIMKPMCRAFTVQQPPSVIKVLEEMARIRQCSLNVVPGIEKYNWMDVTNRESVNFENPSTYLNASLAMQLSHNWMSYKKEYNSTKGNNNTIMNNNSIEETNVLVKDIPLVTLKGIQTVFWLGRCQILKYKNINCYMDGAHTIESIEICTKWFKNQCSENSYKILMFNITGSRNPVPMMELLMKCDFDMALFVPNVAFDEKKKANNIDQVYSDKMANYQISQCRQNAILWKNKISEINRDGNKTNVHVLLTVSSAIDFIISHCRAENITNPNVLITGSLYLVGAALNVLDPSVFERKNKI